MRTYKAVFLLCATFLGFVAWAEEPAPDLFCFFHPPEGWEVTDPSSLSPHVQIAFRSPKKQGFCPSINLAVEQTTVSLAEYMKAVKGIHEQDRNNQWRALGKVHTAAGIAQLTQIDTSSEWGRIRILQLILLKSGRAYVLTAAALKEECSKFYQEIQTAFRSLTLTSDLLQPIVQLEKRELLKEKKQQLIDQTMLSSESLSLELLLKHPLWLSFEQEIASHTSEMGPYWQLLVLKQVQDQLLNRSIVDQAEEHPSLP